MSAFTLDDDTVATLICVLGAAYALWRCVARFRQGRKALAGVWFVVAGTLIAIAVFMQTFTIRLM